jgi:predicted small secreted protein
LRIVGRTIAPEATMENDRNDEDADDPVLLAASAMILMACNTVEGAGQDVKATGKAVERAAKRCEAEVSAP